MVNKNTLVGHEAWRLIVVAALSNLVFKTALVGLLGNRRLLRQIALLYAIPAAGGVALIVSWDWLLAVL
jgi:hypothetical protein